jgi:hypothetical protein
MNDADRELLTTLRRIRTRWRAFAALRTWAWAAAAAALILAAALAAHYAWQPAAPGLIGLWGAAVGCAAICLGWLLVPLGRTPSDEQLARFVEERCPELEDALATAIAQRANDDSSPMRRAVTADAARRVRAIELDRVIAADRLRRAALLALAASAALLAVGIPASRPVSEAATAGALYLFPERLHLEVAPGDAQVKAGDTLRIIARLPGHAGAIVPSLRVERDGKSRAVEMVRGDDGFTASLDDLQGDFRYAVVAAGTSSREYAVTVMHPPRVQRIDVHYEYPAALAMKARVEEDGGDIYGPAGTRVRLLIHTDRPVAEGALTFADGTRTSLAAVAPTLVSASLEIVADGAYRVGLTSAERMAGIDDTEYFVRILQDSPPDVRILRPAGDQPVTPIEEVPIAARADDDFGIAAFDLVFAVRGRSEQVVPFRRSGDPTSLDGAATLYLEDLRVHPGDFVSYYARARDVSRGKRSSEARSDIFFLEVKPFEEEFVAAQSQGAGGGGEEGDGSLEALIAGQKDVIAATWRLDRRQREARTQSSDDVRAVAGAQLELRRRAAGAPSRRDAVVPGGQRPRNQSPADSSNPIVKAIEAMDRAHAELQVLKTSAALPHEMTALHELLRARAEIRRREVQRQEANNNSGGAGSNRQTQDLSSLFDRELARQQTNYETPPRGELRQQKKDKAEDALDKIRELARRQEAANREQERLANSRMSEEERRRELERLTREQTELRQQTDELSQQLERQSRRPQRGQQRGREQGQQSGAEAGRALRDASEEMRGAASGLRRQDQDQAAASGKRALDRLRQTEQQMRGTQPDEQRRQLGDLQLEARQMAETQRRLSREGRTDPSDRDAPLDPSPGRRGNPEGGRRVQGAPADNARRQAGEQERLADRMQRLEHAVRQLAEKSDGRLGEARRDLDRQKLSERMREVARARRDAAAAGDRASNRRPQQEGEQISRALEQLGDRLGAAAGESPEDQRSAAQLARARDLRERLEAVDREVGELQRNSGEQGRAGRAGGGRTAQPQSPDHPVGTSGATSGAWEHARELLRELRQEPEIGLEQDASRFNPGLSAPGTEAWKQDFARWEQLKVQVAAALERLETNSVARLRARDADARLNAGGSQAVPERYRELVDKYYRALAASSAARPRARSN